MAATKRIAVYCPDELAVDIDLALSAWETGLADPAAPLAEELRRFDEEGYDCFVVMDGAAGDKEVAGAVAAYGGGMRIVFVANSLRSCPSPLFNALVAAGRYDIVANDTSEPTYDYLDAMVKVVMHPKSKQDALKCCVPSRDASRDPRKVPGGGAQS